MQDQITTAWAAESRPESAPALSSGAARGVALACGHEHAGDLRDAWRSTQREKSLQSALRKRALGVPTYTVPEAAALMSRSQEHLYRQIRANAFPAIDIGGRGSRGYYVVPAKAIDAMLDAATEAGAVVSAADFGSVGGAR